MSDSVYSDEEKDIEDAEKRETIKPHEFTLPPLNLDKVDTARNDKREGRSEKRNIKHNSKRQLKRTSERDPTPYYLVSSHEHGGKENASSTYTLGQRSSPIRSDTNAKTRPVSSPSRPKSSTTRHSKAAPEVRKPHRPSHDAQTKERHSRKSIHSRTQSRHSSPIAPRKRHDRSRTQSSAFPFFDAQTVMQDAARRASGTTSTAVSPPTEKHDNKGGHRKSRATSDLSGNLTFYEPSVVDPHVTRQQAQEHDNDDDDDEDVNMEEATTETLRGSSIGLRASNGRVISTATRQSRLVSLHLASSPPPPPTCLSPFPTPSPSPTPPPPPKSTRRTIIAPLILPASSPPAPAKAGAAVPQAKPHSLCLFPRESMSDARRESVPLSVVQKDGGDGGVDATSERGEGSRGKNWGSLSLKGIVGRKSRWVSGGRGGYWDKQGKEDKVFI